MKNANSINEQEQDRLFKLDPSEYQPYSRGCKWANRTARFGLKSLLAVGASLGIYAISDQILTEDSQMNKALYDLLTYAIAGFVAVLISEIVDCGMNRNKKGTSAHQFWKESQHQSQKLISCFNKESSKEFTPLRLERGN